MKIKPEDLKLLTEAITKVKEAHPDSTLQAYFDNKVGGDVKMRWRWDVFHAARKYLPEDFVSSMRGGLYSYLNDNNIDTALRFILKDDLASVNQP
jgi:hypothetical protein